MPRVVALVTLGVYPPLGEEVYNGCVCVVGEGGCCCCCNSGPLKILKNIEYVQFTIYVPPMIKLYALARQVHPCKFTIPSPPLATSMWAISPASLINMVPKQPNGSTSGVARNLHIERCLMLLALAASSAQSTVGGAGNCGVPSPHAPCSTRGKY
jgi:hypothetical protein